MKRIGTRIKGESNVFKGFLLLMCLLTGTTGMAQVPVKLYLDSPYGYTESVYLAGNVNGWAYQNEAYQMVGPDARGLFSITLDLTENSDLTYAFDVDSGPYLSDPFNSLDPVYDGFSQLAIANPMITYLLPQASRQQVPTPMDSIWALVTFKDSQPITESSISLKLNGVEIPDAGQYYDAVSREFVYYPGDLPAGEYVIELSVSSSAGTAVRSVTVQRAPAIMISNKISRYFSEEITLYGRVTSSWITEFELEVNGAITTVSVTDGEFRAPVTLVEGVNSIVAAPGTSNSVSKEIEYVSLNKPQLAVTAAVTADLQVDLDVNVTNQGEETLTYEWTQVYGPEPAQWLTTNATATQVTLSAQDGDYHFRATATNTRDERFIAGQLVSVREGKASLISRFDPSPWMEKMVIYEINPRSFSNAGTLSGITAGLDELVDLGVNTIYLMPIFESNEYSGYWTIDYYELNELFGTKADLKNLVDVAHEKGIRIFLDLSNSHTSTFNPYFEEPVAIGSDSPFSNFYNWSGPPALDNYTFSLSYSIPDINYNDPLATNYMLWVSEYWIREFDIDGYRGDVSWAIYKRNPAFWKKFRERMKNVKPDLFMVSESFPPYDQVFDDGFDAVFDFNLRGYGYEDANIITNLFNGSGSLDELDAVIRFEYPNAGLPVRFADLHDFDRATMSFGLAKARLLQSLIFTSRGIPFIWSGSEYGVDKGAYNYEVYARNDQFGLREYMKKLMDIRARYISNSSSMDRIENSNNTEVYSTAIKTGGDFVIAVHNFSGSEKTGTMDISALSLNCRSSFILTNLLDNSQEELTYDELQSYAYTVSAYGSLLFHIGEGDPSAVAIEGASEACQTKSLAYSIVDGFDSYLWSVSGGEILSGQGTSSVEINWSDEGAGSAEVDFTMGGGCVTSTSLEVMIAPAPVAAITLEGDLLVASEGASYRWFQDQVVIAATTRQIEWVSGATYQVEVTNGAGCSTLSGEISPKVLGLDESTFKAILYPNPTTDEVNIQLNSLGSGPVVIAVRNLAGQLIQSSVFQGKDQATYRMDFAGYTPGIYVLDIQAGGLHQVYRIVKR